MTSKATMVINIDANLNKSAQQRARNDPGVAAILKSFGISKVEDYVYQDRKKLKKLVSYIMTVSDAEEAKYLIKKVAQVLPEVIDDDDEKVIDNAIDDIVMTQKQKRQTIKPWWYYQFTERPVPVTKGPVTEEPVTTVTRPVTEKPITT